jgi:hypothetical protein
MLHAQYARHCTAVLTHNMWIDSLSTAHCSTLLTAIAFFSHTAVLQFLRPAANTACAVASCAFARAKGLLVIGFTTGVFGLYEMPSGAVVHTLSVGQKGISSAAIAPQGEWLAFGCAAFGQLLVWEWQVLSLYIIYHYYILAYISTYFVV